MRLSSRLLIICLSLFGLLILGVPQGGMSQVVTPSFDPTRPVLMPSASGWRDASVASGTYQEGNGTRRLNGSQIYQFDASGFDANVAYKTGNFFLEAAFSQLETDRNGEITTEGEINYEKNKSQLSVTLVGNGFVTIGLGTVNDESLDFVDATDDSVTTLLTKTIGSISVKPSEKFLVGLGFERVKESRSNGLGINWNNVIAGVAMKLGTPGGTQFRTEYSIAISDREESYVPTDPTPTIHNATNGSVFSMELMFSGLLFTISTEETTIKLDDDNTENGVSVTQMTSFISKKGVMWIPSQGGLSLGFYFIDYGRSASYSDDNSLFQIDVGYIF